MDLTGHHSNLSKPVRAVLDWATTNRWDRDAAANRTRGVAAVADGSIARAHCRHDWVIAAVVRVLDEHGKPMRAREVHGAVEGLLGTSVRWDSVKACLASNVAGQAPRFVRLRRGWYALLPEEPHGR
jgi:hypothetical protein